MKVRVAKTIGIIPQLDGMGWKLRLLIDEDVVDVGLTTAEEFSERLQEAIKRTKAAAEALVGDGGGC